MKNKIRVIARLDIKAPYVVKGIQMEGLKKLGDPNEFAKNYYEQGADEILYIDVVASLFNRNSLLEIVKNTTENIFVPITVGGGIRTVDDARLLLRAGADKIAINTAAIKNPPLITDLANAFGSQCVVISIHAKETNKENWEVYYDSGREHTGINAIDWAKKAESYGAGEILVTSVDRDGTQAGCNNALFSAISETVSIPVIASGGVGCTSDVVKLANSTRIDAVAIGSALHFKKTSIAEIKQALQTEGHKTRVMA